MSRLLLLAALLAACGPAADRERLADQAYGQERYPEALESYQALARDDSDGRLWAKAGAAALHAARPRDAVEAYRELAGADPTRVGEAADGLELTARTAERANDAVALRDAVVALRAIAPDRNLGRYALSLVRTADLDPGERLALLPAALAAADEAPTVDTLLAAYADALRREGACDRAAPAFRAVLRRSRDAAGADPARAGLATCAVVLGERATAAGRADIGERWYAEAVRQDSASTVGRRALVGIGSARAAQGDSAAAAAAYRAAITLAPEPDDTIARRAADALAALVPTVPADTAPSPTP